MIPMEMGMKASTLVEIKQGPRTAAGIPTKKAPIPTLRQYKRRSTTDQPQNRQKSLI